MGVDVGVVIPNMEPYAGDVSLLVEVAKVADEGDVGYVLMWDHYSLPWSDEALYAWVMLSYLAVRTNNAKFGTCVSPYSI